MLFYFFADPAEEYRFISVNVRDVVPQPLMLFIGKVAPDQESGDLLIVCWFHAFTAFFATASGHPTGDGFNALVRLNVHRLPINDFPHLPPIR